MKINRLYIISKLGRINITIEVYEELNRCKYLIKPLISEIQEGNIGLTRSGDYSHLQKKYTKLGTGELSVIASAKGMITFIEDRDAEDAARDEGLRVYNIPEVLLACKKMGLIGKEEIEQIIKELKEKDGYVFKQEIEENLIR